MATAQEVVESVNPIKEKLARQKLKGATWKLNIDNITTR